MYKRTVSIFYYYQYTLLLFLKIVKSIFNYFFKRVILVKGYQLSTKVIFFLNFNEFGDSFKLKRLLLKFNLPYIEMGRKLPAYFLSNKEIFRKTDFGTFLTYVEQFMKMKDKTNSNFRSLFKTKRDLRSLEINCDQEYLWFKSDYILRLMNPEILYVLNFHYRFDKQFLNLVKKYTIPMVWFDLVSLSQKNYLLKCFNKQLTFFYYFNFEFLVGYYGRRFVLLWIMRFFQLFFFKKYKKILNYE